MATTDILLRLGVAMLVGALIGVERESSHRPAGLRTHMLVSIGAAVVMMLGTYLFTMYEGRTSADPARLGAQVISGIGFLGAGTIIREGSSIKGLTTAASLWAVACLGLAAGAGFYQGALLGMLVIFLTLTFVEQLQSRVMRGKETRMQVYAVCEDASQMLMIANRLAQQYAASLSDFVVERREDNYKVAFRLQFNTMRKAINYTQVTADLANAPGVIKLSTEAI